MTTDRASDADHVDARTDPLEPPTSGGDADEDDRDDDHLADLPDGSGCTEIWEHVAERRADED